MLFLIRMKSGSMTVISRNNYYGNTIYPLTSCKVHTPLGRSLYSRRRVTAPFRASFSR